MNIKQNFWYCNSKDDFGSFFFEKSATIFFSDFVTLMNLLTTRFKRV